MNKNIKNQWKIYYSVSFFNINETQQNKITGFYCSWLKNKQNNFDIKLVIDKHIDNKEWKIKFGEICNTLINKNNEKEQYLLSKL